MSETRRSELGSTLRIFIKTGILEGEAEQVGNRLDEFDLSFTPMRAWGRQSAVRCHTIWVHAIWTHALRPCGRSLRLVTLDDADDLFAQHDRDAEVVFGIAWLVDDRGLTNLKCCAPGFAASEGLKGAQGIGQVAEGLARSKAAGPAKPSLLTIGTAEGFEGRL